MRTRKPNFQSQFRGNLQYGESKIQEVLRMIERADLVDVAWNKKEERAYLVLFERAAGNERSVWLWDPIGGFSKRAMPLEGIAPMSKVKAQEDAAKALFRAWAQTMGTPLIVSGIKPAFAPAVKALRSRKEDD